MEAPKHYPYLTTAQVGEIFGVSPKTVTRWARQGKLPHSRTLGGHRRYARADIRRIAPNQARVPF